MFDSDLNTSLITALLKKMVRGSGFKNPQKEQAPMVKNSRRITAHYIVAKGFT